MDIIPVIHLGLGPIGQTIGKAVAENAHLQSVGAVDIDPAIVGRFPGDICDAKLPAVAIVDSLAAVRAPEGAVVLQATVSRLTAAREQLLAAIARGYHVVSTCEELVWPWDDHPGLAAELDRAARKSGVALLGVGVNPGFIMDTLPVLLSFALAEVEAVSVTRTVDLNERRGQLQRKMGVGLEPDVVRQRLAAEQIGHVGLGNSMQMLAAGLGWRLDVIDIDQRPLIARDPLASKFGPVEPGQCSGLRQRATGVIGGIPRIILTLHMELGADGGSRDELLVHGEQSLRLRLDGMKGDQATAALVVNMAQRIRRLPPGLHTMLSLPLLTEKKTPA